MYLIYIGITGFTYTVQNMLDFKNNQLVGYCVNSQVNVTYE